MRIVVGGTFDPLHIGHKSLLERAFQLGDEILIGVCSDEFARSRRSREVLPYNLRKMNLELFLQKLNSRYGKRYSIIQLEDRYGPTISQDFDGIIVSPETYPVAVEINRMRRSKGLKPLKIFKIDFVLGSDGERISSTRIKSGEIDRYGNPIICEDSF